MKVLDYLKVDVNCILKPSRIGGVGFFAVRDIQENEQMFKPWTGESGIYSISHEELKQLPEELADNIFNTFHHKLDYIDTEGREVTVPKQYGQLFFPLIKGVYWLFVWPKMYMNSGLNKHNVESNSNILPIAVRTIKKGEEILGNYGSQFKSTPKNFL